MHHYGDDFIIEKKMCLECIKAVKKTKKVLTQTRKQTKKENSKSGKRFVPKKIHLTNKSM